MIDGRKLVPSPVALYEWLRVWHERQANPPHLPRHALLLFQAFKAAYDGKDVGRLAPLVADDYAGDVFGARSKGELLGAQAEAFRGLWWFIRPCLIVNVYCILEDEPGRFRAIIDTQSRALVLGIPTVNYDSAPVRCEIRRRGDGVWQVGAMWVEWELVRPGK